MKLDSILERLNPEEWEDELGNIKLKKIQKYNKRTYFDDIISGSNLYNVGEHRAEVVNRAYDYFKKSKIDASHNPVYEKKKGSIFKWFLEKGVYFEPGMFTEDGEPEDIVNMVDNIGTLIMKLGSKFDINKYNGFNDLKNNAIRIKLRKEGKEFDLDKFKDIEKVTGCKILTINKDVNYEAYRKLIDRTEWCTKSRPVFDNYTMTGNLYVIIKGKELYQLHFQDGQFMDEANNPIDISKDLPIEVIHDCIRKEKKEGRLKKYKLVKDGFTHTNIHYDIGGKKRSESSYKNDKLYSKDGKPSRTEYYSNGKVHAEEWYKDGEEHREDGPALIWYYRDGKVNLKKWVKNGVDHREDGPAYVKYYDNGEKFLEKWIKGGKHHRVDGPAFVEYYEDGNKRFERWYKNGEVHREDGPAYTMYYENRQVEFERWFKDGELYKEIKYDKDGSKLHTKN